MRILRLSSCLLSFIFLSACNSSHKTHISLPEPYINKAYDGLVYDAAFSFRDFHASGLLVLKKVDNAYHVVLLSKFGPTLMEFKLDDKGIAWIKSFEKLNRKSIESLIETDFRVILLTMLNNPGTVHQLKTDDRLNTYKIKGLLKSKIKADPETNRVVYATNRGFPNLFKTKARFFYEGKEVPEEIEIRHNNINLKLDLNLLKTSNAER